MGKSRSQPANAPETEALRAELAAVILALLRATTAAEAATLTKRRNLLGRQIAHLQGRISGTTSHNENVCAKMGHARNGKHETA